MTADEFRDIISEEAYAIVEKEVPRGEEYDKARKAQLDFYVVVVGLRSKESVETVLRWAVVGVAVGGSWADCKPDPTRWPKGFESHADFVTEAVEVAACSKPNIKSRLIKLGNLALFARDNSVDIDPVMNGPWTRLRDGLPAIGVALDNEDAEELEEVLDDIQELSPHEFKSKYVTPRHKKAGTATVRTTDHGTVVLVAVLNGPSEMDRVVGVLQGLFEWGLNARVSDDGRGTVIHIEGALAEVWTDAINEKEPA